MNEIWVPSQFNIETFANNGVDRKKLFQIPESVDVFTFDPDVTPTLVLTSPPPTKIMDDNNKDDNDDKKDADDTNSIKDEKKKEKFTFLTAMKWEKRKGWDLLIRAYFQEFIGQDDVVLFVLSRLSEEDRINYMEEVKTYCYDVRIVVLVHNNCHVNASHISCIISQHYTTQHIHMVPLQRCTYHPYEHIHCILTQPPITSHTHTYHHK